MTSSGNVLEDTNRRILAAALAKDFETFDEVPVRHSLFPVNLRIDLLLVPRDRRFSDIALAIETKGHREWDVPSLSRCLKQASDYVLATVLPGSSGVRSKAVGRRIMATFIYPAPLMQTVTPDKEEFFRGMIHMAAYHRVGSCYVDDQYREHPLVLRCPHEVWVSTRGWRADAANILLGKRQIGSTRVNILNALRELPGAAPRNTNPRDPA